MELEVTLGSPVTVGQLLGLPGLADLAHPAQLVRHTGPREPREGLLEGAPHALPVVQPKGRVGCGVRPFEDQAALAVETVDVHAHRRGLDHLPVAGLEFAQRGGDHGGHVLGRGAPTLSAPAPLR